MTEPAPAPAPDVAFVKLNVESIAAVWPMIEPLLAPMCEERPHLFQAHKLLDLAEGGDIQLWVAWSPAEQEILAVAGTETRKGLDESLSLVVMFCTGHDRVRWEHFLEGIEAWGRSVGCVRAEFWARLGWKLPGYRRTHVLLEKELF